MNKALQYLKDRFTKEKISSGLGVVLALAGALGYLSGPEVAALHTASQLMGYDIGPVSTITALAGAISILVPTSRIKKREAQ